MWATKQLGHTDSTFTARTYSRWIDRDAPESGMLPVAKWQRSSIDWWLNGGDWLPSI